MKKALTKEKFNRLLKQIGQDKKRAFKSFFDLYGRFIYLSAYSVCRSSSISDEAVNDVLLAVWKWASEGRPEIDNPEGWLYKISVNAAKRKMEGRNLPLNEDIVRSENEIDRFIEEDAFYSYLEGLTDDEQFILIARFIQGMKFEEIALAMGSPLSTITTRYYRALNKIRQKIEES